MMKSYQIDEHLILTEGRCNSILVDFNNKKVAHIKNTVKDQILNRCMQAIPKQIQSLLPADLDKSHFTTISSKQDNSQKIFKKLWFDISGVCNLRCKGCYAEPYMHDSRSGFVSDELIKFTKKLAPYFKSIDILGGEPFANPDLISILREFCPEFSQVVIYTNGTIVKPDVIELCKQKGVFVKVSLYGITRNDHEAFTKKHGSFKDTMDFLIMCRDYGIKLRVGYLLTEISKVKDKKKIMAFLNNYGLSCVFDIERSPGKILGGISPKRFFNFRKKGQYISNLFAHPCIDKKMGIDVDGNLYHCPMERGNNKQGVLELGIDGVLKVMKQEWKNNLSNRYTDCVSCEFRALCSDCFVLDPVSGQYPANCIYDPQRGQFREQELSQIVFPPTLG